MIAVVKIEITRKLKLKYVDLGQDFWVLFVPLVLNDLSSLLGYIGIYLVYMHVSPLVTTSRKMARNSFCI